MEILIIDGKGGKIGAQLVAEIKKLYPESVITAVGTNGIATAAMVKAGADYCATGENPVVVACRTAQIIIGPIGIVIADSLIGEITPLMAKAVGQSRAKKILLPVNRCDNIVVGVQNLSVNELIAQAIEMLDK